MDLGSPDIQAAARVAEHIGSEHHQLTFTADDLARALPHVIYHLESADVDLVRSAIPTHFATKLARQHVKAVLTGEGADELFAGYAYHHAYARSPRALADELTRSLTGMHNVNLQRVDRITMAQGLEARTPFLDRDLIDFAQSIPASVKMRITDELTGQTTEKWILRKACQDLLPADLICARRHSSMKARALWTHSTKHCRLPPALRRRWIGSPKPGCTTTSSANSSRTRR